MYKHSHAHTHEQQYHGVGERHLDAVLYLRSMLERWDLSRGGFLSMGGKVRAQAARDARCAPRASGWAREGGGGEGGGRAGGDFFLH